MSAYRLSNAVPIPAAVMKSSTRRLRAAVLKPGNLEKVRCSICQKNYVLKIVNAFDFGVCIQS